jgi:hypothetical protein
MRLDETAVATRSEGATGPGAGVTVGAGVGVAAGVAVGLAEGVAVGVGCAPSVVAAATFEYAEWFGPSYARSRK